MRPVFVLTTLVLLSFSCAHHEPREAGEQVLEAREAPPKSAEDRPLWNAIPESARATTALLERLVTEIEREGWPEGTAREQLRSVLTDVLLRGAEVDRPYAARLLVADRSDGDRPLAARLFDMERSSDGVEHLHELLHELATCQESTALDHVLIELATVDPGWVLSVLESRVENELRLSPLQFVALARIPGPEAREFLRNGFENESFDALVLDAAKEAAGSVLAYQESFAERRYYSDLNVADDSGAGYGIDWAALERDGFLITDVTAPEMSNHYETSLPFVTTDLAARSFAMLVKLSLTELERYVLVDAYRTFALEMATACLELAGSLEDQELAALSRKNAAFFAVGSTLLGSEVPEVPGWEDEIRAEVARIRAHEARAGSELLGGTRDYRSFQPQGRLSNLPEFAGYFECLVLFGATEFKLAGPRDDVLLMAEVLDRNPELQSRWQRIDLALSRLLGPSECVTFADLGSAPLALRDDPREWERRVSGAKKSDEFRVLGQRVTVYSQTLSELEEFWPLSGLHVIERLTDHPFPRRLLKERGFHVPSPLPTPPCVSVLDRAVAAGGLLFEPDPRRPEFMKSEAWLLKQTNTALGSWSDLGHGFAGYAQVVISLGGPVEAYGIQGYVEPVPDYYRALALEVEAWLEVLDQFELWNASEEVLVDRAHFERLRWLLDNFAEIADLELQGRRLFPRHGVLLAELLDHLRYLDIEERYEDYDEDGNRQIWSCATSLSGECVQVGTADPRMILVLVETEGIRRVCRGAVYSYCEFVQPLSEQLDDAAWTQSMESPPRGLFLPSAPRAQEGSGDEK